MNVREAIKEWLQYHHISVVFGNPGSTEIPFLVDWPEEISYILGLQESQVVAMADGYAQASRMPAVVNLHSQPGLGHAMGALMSAKRNRTPLVVTIGQEDSRHHIVEPLLYGNLAPWASTVSQWSYQPTSAEDVVPALERAYHEARRPPGGPAAVILPMNYLNGQAVWNPRREIDYHAMPDGMEDLAGILNAAKFPALVMGDEVDKEDAWAQAVGLAEALDCPVFGAPLSMRVGFPNRHPLYQGILNPVMSGIIQSLSPYDVVLVVGGPAFLTYPYIPGSREWGQTRVYHISSDPEYLARSMAAQGYCGSVRAAMETLLTKIVPKEPELPEVELWEAEQKSAAARERADMGSDYVLYTIGQNMPPDTIVVDESVSHSLLLRKILNFTRQGSYYTASNGALGWGLAAAAGIQLAQPGRRVMAVVGDGASLYGMQSLWAIAEHRLPIVIVILNNHGYTILKSLTQSLYPGHLPATPGLTVQHVNFVRLAESMGVRGSKAENPSDLEWQLKEAWSSREPYLLDVQVDAEIPKLL
ncbi:MAG: thiamine pyrophosphate-binding protein [Firmicutes bacterium]|jgi:benzoylformate decarboxylase|nr:thiamine pyrophosphate-binding protein [Bacillota bacterium]MCL5013252.1 thiamine pyrophosphate-binding protein [Bacillota bacterium]